MSVRTIEEPLRQIVENAGEDAAVILNAVKAGKGAYGYNAGTGEYGDMLEEGILDPAKVTDPKTNRTMVWDNDGCMLDAPEGEVRKILLV